MYYQVNFIYLFIYFSNLRFQNKKMYLNTNQYLVIKDKKFVGFVTSGDVRDALSQSSNLENPVQTIMQKCARKVCFFFSTIFTFFRSFFLSFFLSFKKSNILLFVIERIYSDNT